MMIRLAEPEDAETLGRVFYAAVREGPSPYTQPQRAAWLGEVPEGQAWAARLASLHVAVAEVDDEVVGFMAMAAGGYIDLVFIRPEHRGAGLFRALFQQIESHARAQGWVTLTTDASLLAQPAFQAMGFSTIHHETVERNGERLSRARMEKRLG